MVNVFEGWLRFDERLDVLASLRLCQLCLERVEDEPLLWKGAVLALHGALIGAIVCHLSGHENLGALIEKSAKEHSARHRGDKGIPPRAPRQESPDELLLRLEFANNRIEAVDSSLIPVLPEERGAFGRLTELRNQFTHFLSKGWSIPLAPLPRILWLNLNLFDKIAADPWPFRHMSDEERTSLLRLLHDLRALLQKLESKLSSKV